MNKYIPNEYIWDMVLVTGGTGLLGAHLLFYLLDKEIPVKAIHRKHSDLHCVKKVFSYYTEHVDALFNEIIWVEADLNDIPALENAFIDVTHVYHAAALISFDPRDYDRLKKTNVKGTINIVNLCIAKNIQKLCYVSTIGAIGQSIDGEPATEESEWNPAHANVYALTKHDAEMEVWRASQEGLDVVIVNPGVILGPGYWKTGSGKLFSVAAKGQRYYPPSGTGFISVGDTVKIMMGLMESSFKNNRFIAVSENRSYKEVLDAIATGLKKPKPAKKLAFWQLEILCRLDGLVSFFTRKKRKLTRNNVRSLRRKHIYSNEKVTEFLEFKYEPLAEAITFSCHQYSKENA